MATLFDNGNVAYRRPLNNALKAMLSVATTRPVEVGMAPTTDADALVPADLPYIIIYPIPGPAPKGSLGLPETDAQFQYQIQAVGESSEQVEAVIDAVTKAICGRSDSGGFLFNLSPDNLNVQGRWALNLGDTPKRTDKLYSLNKDFAVMVNTKV